MFYVWGSHSVLAAPWFSSCTDISSRSSTFVGPMPPPGPPPESRATKSILLLGSTFVYFYILSSICQVLLALFDPPSWFLVNITIIIAACFPTVSPFLLISHNSSVQRLYFAWRRNAKSSTIMRKVWILFISIMSHCQFIYSPSES